MKFAGKSFGWVSWSFFVGPSAGHFGSTKVALHAWYLLRPSKTDLSKTCLGHLRNLLRTTLLMIMFGPELF